MGKGSAKAGQCMPLWIVWRGGEEWLRWAAVGAVSAVVTRSPDKLHTSGSDRLVLVLEKIYSAMNQKWKFLTIFGQLFAMFPINIIINL